MTVKEVRAELRISLGKAYELIYTGELRAVRIGRLIRVTPKALREFIAAHECYSD
jgi:excisionase family DNA binding protein